MNTLEDRLHALVNRSLGFDPKRILKKHAKYLNKSKLVQLLQQVTLLAMAFTIGIGVMYGLKSGWIQTPVIALAISTVIEVLILRSLYKWERVIMPSETLKKYLHEWWTIEHLFREVEELFKDPNDNRDLAVQIESMVRTLVGVFKNTARADLVLSIPKEKKEDKRLCLKNLVRLVIHLKLMNSDKIQFEKTGNPDFDRDRLAEIIYRKLFENPAAELA